jgi:hypothetical protein
MFEEVLNFFINNLILPLLVVYLVFKFLFSIKPCELCKKVTGSIKIVQCGHEICKLCLNELVKTMSEKKLNLKCPGNKKKCNQFICHEVILSNLEEGDKTKFKELIDKSNEYIYCPNSTCNNYFDQNGKSFISLCKEIDPNFKLNCSKCNKKYCFKCKSVFHDNKSCKEYQQENKINEDDNKLKNLNDLCKNKLKECPICKKWLEVNQLNNNTKCKSCNKNKSLDLNKSKIIESKKEESNYKHNNYDPFDFKGREEKFLNSTSAKNRLDENRNDIIDNFSSDYNNKFQTPNGKNKNLYSLNDQSTSAKTKINDETNFKDISNYSYDYTNSINKLNETIYLDNSLFKDKLNQSNFTSSDLKMKTTAKYYGPGPNKQDGSLDMRYSVNKQYVKDSNIKPTYETTGYYGSGPSKNDGTLDMRYSVNKEEVRSSLIMSGNFSSSTYTSKCSYSDYSKQSTNYSSSGPMKNDGTPDMRYSTNKSYAQNFPSAGYMNSSGPLKKDGTPDMRYSVNKR